MRKERQNSGFIENLNQNYIYKKGDYTLSRKLSGQSPCSPRYINNIYENYLKFEMYQPKKQANDRSASSEYSAVDIICILAMITAMMNAKIDII